MKIDIETGKRALIILHMQSLKILVIYLENQVHYSFFQIRLKFLIVRATYEPCQMQL